MLLLKNCKLVLTLEKERPLLKNTSIVIEDGLITEVGKEDKSGEIVDCSNLLIMPALVNSFVKLESPIKDFPHSLAIKMMEIFLIDSLISGTPTLLTFLTRFKEHVEEVAGNMGLRLITVTSLNFSDLLSLSFDVSRKDGLRVIDLALTRREVFRIKNETGRFPVELLYEKELLDENTIIVCPAWITSREIPMIAERGAKVVTCASISAYSGLGSFVPIKEMMNKGVTVGLGTYDPKVNMNMFEEAKFSLMYYRYNYWDMSLGETTFLELASHGGCKVINVDAGTVREGRGADLIGINLERAFLDQKYLVNSFRGSVSLAVVNGKVILNNNIINNMIYKRERLMREINDVLFNTI